MPRKKESSYRQAIEKLREKHADKVEEVFLKMYDIALHGKEQKDSVNAAKVAVSLLGVPRAATERAPAPKKGIDVPAGVAKPTAEELAVIEERLAS